MTNKQEAVEKMSQTSLSFLKLNKDIMATTPNFMKVLTAIECENEKIQVVKVLQEQRKRGGNVVKGQLHEMLIGDMLDVKRRLVAYATNENDATLNAMVDYSETDLRRYSDSKLVSCCQVMCNAARAKLTELGGYGVAEATVNALQALIDKFDVSISNQRVETIDTGEATRQLAEGVKQLMLHWKKMDVLVDMHKVTQPAFYSEYQQVRRVVVMGKTSLALKLRVINAQTGEPEANVALTIAPANEKPKGAAEKGKGKLVKKTAKHGGAYIKNLGDGEYAVTAEKQGFRAVTETVNVVGGERAVVEIRIEKS